MQGIHYIDDSIRDKRVLLRVDFNVTLNADRTISDDYRIRQVIPTIQLLLHNGNKLILVSHLGKRKGVEERYSLSPVVDDLKKYLPDQDIVLIKTPDQLPDALLRYDIVVLENSRFFQGETTNDPMFAHKLAENADVYVNDAFGVSHRNDASIVAITQFLPSFGGLLLKKEIETIENAIKDPKHPVVVIIGGAKVSTKITVIGKLMEIADHLLVGGGLANTFFAAENIPIGNSFYEKEAVILAQDLKKQAVEKKTEIILPVDVILGSLDDPEKPEAVCTVPLLLPSENREILDIGPETQALWGSFIAKAKTIIWNGPVGYIEKPLYSRGTDFIYYSITQNQECLSLVGGGDTIASISKKEYLDHITHISTGGGAMLEFIEKGTLPGIEALKQ